MKAISYTKYGSPDVLKLIEVDKPIPKENEVLIKINASTITAVDSIFRKGDQFFARMATGIIKPKNPVLGTEFAGEIEAVGNEVKLFKKGDKVFGVSDMQQGTHAEYLCLPEDHPMIMIPENMSFEEAAAVPAGSLTALPFLRDNGKVKNKTKILIIGASGSVGTYAVQLAKFLGAEVTGVCSTANLELVVAIGADKVIDYTKEDFTRSSKKYDVIFDTIGKSSFSKSKKSLTKNGIFLTTYISLSILLQMLHTSLVGSKRAIIAFTGLRKSEEKKKDLVFIKELILTGKLKPILDRTYPLEEIAEAYKYVDKGHKKGNVVITV